MRHIRVILVLAIVFAASPALADYYVYCANNRVEVTHSDPRQMRIARGSGVCTLGQFRYLGDAQSFARRNFGGAAARCSCR